MVEMTLSMIKAKVIIMVMDDFDDDVSPWLFCRSRDQFEKKRERKAELAVTWLGREERRRGRHKGAACGKGARPDSDLGGVVHYQLPATILFKYQTFGFATFLLLSSFAFHNTIGHFEEMSTKRSFIQLTLSFYFFCPDLFQGVWIRHVSLNWIQERSTCCVLHPVWSGLWVCRRCKP